MKNNKPIMIFDNQEQAIKCLRYWQKQLSLSDWLIKIKINQSCVDECYGDIKFNFVHKAAIIRIADPNNIDDNLMLKFCAEKTLVHELLHLKLDLFREEALNYEDNYVEIHEHSNLEDIAKAFIMIKYQLKKDWFLNL